MSLCIVVPYRDRAEHLELFIPSMRAYLPDDQIVVVEQADEKAFNRGKLLNIGYLESKATHYVFHDVDMIPIKVGYIEREGVTQLAFSDVQMIDYLGGVTMFEGRTFREVGGYHNDYFHRAEDNEMRFKLKKFGIRVLSRFGIFKQLPHTRTGPEFIPELWQKAQLPRTKDMLKTCEYKLISKEVKDGYTHLKVEL